MAAAVGNNLQRTVAGDNGAVEWFLMFWRSASTRTAEKEGIRCTIQAFQLGDVQVACTR
jgi:hypothetical protein